jgi:hypothetical protein
MRVLAEGVADGYGHIRCLMLAQAMLRFVGRVSALIPWCFSIGKTIMKVVKLSRCQVKGFGLVVAGIPSSTNSSESATYGPSEK